LKPLLVVDSPKRWPLKIPGMELVSSYQYLSDPEYAQGTGRKVFNLCRSFRYQAAGYYVSLLAEARGHKPLPSVSVIQDLKLAPVIRVASQDLDELIQENLKRIKSEEFDVSIYFGHNLAGGHDRLAQAVFNAFPAPLLRARFEKDGRWRLTGVKVIGLGDVPESHRPFVIEQAERYLKRSPRKSKTAPPSRFDLAILRNSQEDIPPSNEGALKKFIQAGESIGIRCELIEKDSYGRIAEFDGLFIRETTQVNHHTYRFARRATVEGMVVVDDPRSIVRCTNKVYLAETLNRHRLATPRTLILSSENAAAGIRSLGFPCVLKKPDSAFSIGVKRLDSDEGLEQRLEQLFEESDLLIAQEFVPTDYDWRIGVLGGKPLFACRYGMAPGHWQIVLRDGDDVEYGDFSCVPVQKVPDEVLKLAVKSAALMGEGLYGVDLKVVGGKAVVIEVNDNPNIDAGIEDALLGDQLYVAVMDYFLRRFEEPRS
jgi:glutathione synthase/RimK-type ligase-like ATP-grasp enzyme